MDEWYTASLTFVVDVEGEDKVRRSRSVVILRAPGADFERARAIALSMGRDMQRDYLNVDGKLVRWALENVETVDWIGPELEDGREVYHEFSDEVPRNEIAWPLEPDGSAPAVSGV